MGSRLSISSTCKDVDAAWGFVRRMLLEDYYSDEGRYVNGYPLNMAAYEKAEAAAMEKRYETDPETGEPRSRSPSAAGAGTISAWTSTR